MSLILSLRTSLPPSSLPMPSISRPSTRLPSWCRLLAREFYLKNPPGTGILLRTQPNREPPKRPGTGILFQEPNPTGSRQRDLIGLCGPTQETPPPSTQKEDREIFIEGGNRLRQPVHRKRELFIEEEIRVGGNPLMRAFVLECGGDSWTRRRCAFLACFPFSFSVSLGLAFCLSFASEENS